MESTFMDDAVVYFQDIAIISSADVFFFFLSFERLSWHNFWFTLWFCNKTWFDNDPKRLSRIIVLRNNNTINSRF